jgi:hypothetical protein
MATLWSTKETHKKIVGRGADAVEADVTGQLVHGHTQQFGSRREVRRVLREARRARVRALKAQRKAAAR